jgi:polyisoprenoid-binding protein YceI
VLERVIWTAAVAIAAAAPYAQCAPRTYSIEPAGTVLSFEVRNLGIAKRQGLFGSVTGNVSLDTQAGNGSVDIVVDARSVKTSDPATRAFLRGKSFLNVERYSEIVYKGGRVIFANDKPVRVEGELTLLGITKSVPLAISDFQCEYPSSGARRCVLEAATTFKRSEFGMNRYMTLVSDDVTLFIRSVTISEPDIQLKLAATDPPG